MLSHRLVARSVGQSRLAEMENSMKRFDYANILNALARLITAIAVLIAALRRG